jgi:hypothetical protein
MTPLLQRQRRNGFSLVETTVAIGLTTCLAMALSTSWILLGRPTTEAAAWGQLFQEMDLSVASLARDLGGSQPDCTDADGLPGDKKQGLLAACRASHDSSGDHLQLCFDGGIVPDGLATWDSPTNDTVIDYYVSSGSSTLVRWNQKTGATFTVAKNVAGMTVAPYAADANCLQIDLTFTFCVKATQKTLTRQCTLVVKKSP